MDCGGSSFELEVLTVSTQPVRGRRSPMSQYQEFRSVGLITVEPVALRVCTGVLEWKGGTDLGWVAFLASLGMPSMR